MRSILFLGSPDSAILRSLRAETTCDRIYARSLISMLEVSGGIDGIDFIVSHGYRQILPKAVVEHVPCINVHISYLPWNRGADPNYWSWVDDTPKGVTIHRMDEGLDTGPIYHQRLVDLSQCETLRDSYERLQAEAAKAFWECWPKILDGTMEPVPQRGAGSVHRLADKPELPQGWDTPLEHLQPEDSGRVWR